MEVYWCSRLKITVVKYNVNTAGRSVASSKKTSRT
jgi:hypothetical protein